MILPPLVFPALTLLGMVLVIPPVTLFSLPGEVSCDVYNLPSDAPDEVSYVSPSHASCSDSFDDFQTHLMKLHVMLLMTSFVRLL